MSANVRLVVVMCLSLWVISPSRKSAFAQDPTVPSPQILERLQQPSEPIVMQRAMLPLSEKAEPLPIVKLKAIVMRDPDNGIALVEMNGRRTRLRLSRESTSRTEADSVAQVTKEVQEQAAATEQKDDPLAGITIQGTTYFVESFSPRSILLNSRGQKLLIQ